LTDEHRLAISHTKGVVAPAGEIASLAQTISPNAGPE
jgi:hypothetical protein